MNDLRRVVDAFREENPAGTLDGEAIRRRVLSSFARHPPARRRRFGWLAPMAAVLAASAALAATGRVRWPRALRPQAWFAPHPSVGWVGVPAAHVEAPAPALELPAKEPPARDLPAVEAAPHVLDGPGHDSLGQRTGRLRDKSRTPPHEAERTVSAADGARGRDATAAATAAPAPPVAQAVAEAPTPDELEPFRAARRLHEGSDPTRAAAAWESYLRAFPHGKLAVEARFNRALCLIRAGRTAEAEQALASFAAGEFGSYRLSDAANLLRLLRQSR